MSRRPSRRPTSLGQDHLQAATLLEDVPTPDQNLAGKFRRILSSKDNAHYSPRLLSKSDARSLVTGARVLVDAARAI